MKNNSITCLYSNVNHEEIRGKIKLSLANSIG